MINGLVEITSGFALLITVALGVLWGVLLARAAVFMRHGPIAAAALGSSFLLVFAGLRGLESATPELSVGRSLGTLILWIVFIAAVSIAWFFAPKAHR